MKLPKIFLDSGDPEETKTIKTLLGFLDGQTTNPSLVAKNPEVKKHIDSGKKFTEKDLLSMYKDIIVQIASQLAGPISIETYADWNTSAKEMLTQAEEMATWIHNGYIKFPTIPEGLKAAHEFVKNGGKVNMTLVFDQTQAAAVFSALQTAQHNCLISPFIGRWDDRGYDGLDLVKNIAKQYKQYRRELKDADKLPQAEVQILAASIRHLDHFYSSMALGADILTVPGSVLQEWVDDEKWVPDESYRPESSGKKSLKYEDVRLQDDFSQYDIDKVEGSLLDEGLGKFAKDWNSLLGDRHV